MTDKPTTRESMRAQFPEIAELVDTLRGAGFEPRVMCILDHDGNTLVGTPPSPAVAASMVEAARNPRPPEDIPPGLPTTTTGYRGKHR